MKTLAIDLETYSELDISKVGVYKYAENCEECCARMLTMMSR